MPSARAARSPAASIPGVAGFSLPDSRGVWQGFDTEMCRGLAAVIFNDPSKVRFVPLSSSTRFTALGSGEVDVLFRTSTQTMLRDTSLGLRHVTTYFYDGHGFMRARQCRRHPGAGHARRDHLPAAGHHERTGDGGLLPLDQRAVPAGDLRTPDQAQAALLAGRCDAYGTDASSLAAMRSTMPVPAEWTVLPERFSQGALRAPISGAATTTGIDIVRWYTTAIIEAEEQGVTQANAEEMRRTSVNPNTRRLLGVTPELGQSLKLDPAWAYNVIRAIGNYGEIYERTMGPEHAGRPRARAEPPAHDGGLLYALPMR